MTICRWFLPKCVNLRFPAFFHHLRKARRFHFQKLHVGRAGPPGRPFFRISARPAVAPKKSAREPRQGGSDYRCCIPALAGFVSPQSIAPDGEQTFSQESQRATANAFRDARTAQRSLPTVSQMGDSPLCALHRYCPRALLCSAGVCALQFSRPTNDAAKSALATPCRAR